jgi:hypothetical protein
MDDGCQLVEARIAISDGRVADADSSYSKALMRFEQRFGREYPAIRSLLLDCAAAKQELGQTEEAKALRDRADGIARRISDYKTRQK